MTPTQTSEFQAGDRVRLLVPADHALRTTKWFPKDEATGTVQRTFKNGSVAVAVDQIRNFSEDGKHTLHILAAYLVPLA